MDLVVRVPGFGPTVGSGLGARHGKWWVCVDYMDLNEACPKDSFSLPLIDHIIDASTRHGMLSFLDAFSGYHQIPMHSLRVEKMAFITSHGLYLWDPFPDTIHFGGSEPSPGCPVITQNQLFAEAISI